MAQNLHTEAARTLLRVGTSGRARPASCPAGPWPNGRASCTSSTRGPVGVPAETVARARLACAAPGPPVKPITMGTTKCGCVWTDGRGAGPGAARLASERSGPHVDANWGQPRSAAALGPPNAGFHCRPWQPPSSRSRRPRPAVSRSHRLRPYRARMTPTHPPPLRTRLGPARDPLVPARRAASHTGLLPAAAGTEGAWGRGQLRAACHLALALQRSAQVPPRRGRSPGG